MLQRELYFALLGTGATCLATVLGAGTVFLFKKDMGAGLQRAFLGFAAGVMIAASVWSLLIPAMEMAEEQGQSALLAAGGGCVLGGVFLLLRQRRAGGPARPPQAHHHGGAGGDAAQHP